MQDAFAHCAALVRAADRDRYLATLFAPAGRRNALFALYALNLEIARVREAAREVLPGEIRLTWWSEVLSGERREGALANPVAAALLDAIERYKLETGVLVDLIEAHRFDLYDEPMTTIAELERYLTRTSSALFELAARILGVDAQSVAGPAGIAEGIIGLLRALPVHAARRQLFLPMEVFENNGVLAESIFARQPSADLAAALSELHDLARRQLAVARDRLTALPQQALPAFLPLALVRPWLDRLERSDPFAPASLSPWRRQWLIWRAAKNPARIG